MKLTLCLLLCFTLNVQAQVTIAAAGDIACHKDDMAGCRTLETSELILQQPVTAVLALGDLQYPKGTLRDFMESYDQSWGRFKTITYPTPGNHDYYTKNAQGYFDYLGERAGDPQKGYYSVTIGTWHIISLNSNCDVVACNEHSEQLRWLEQELIKHRNVCTLAFWHHPRFSSGLHGDSAKMIPFWNLLYNYKADVVLSAHDHMYERFARKSWDGKPDPMGPRQFVVGTGGKHLYKLASWFPQSEFLDNKHFGVLFLTLEPTRYTWRFITIEGEVLDQGEEACVH